MDNRGEAFPSSKPLIAVTMGDPAGVGPEVTVRALSSPEVIRSACPVVIGDYEVLQAAAKVTGQTLNAGRVVDFTEIPSRPSGAYVLDLRNIDLKLFQPGRVSADCGKAAMQYIERGTELAVERRVRALVTAPINKEATVLAGYQDIGHLEYLARVTGAKQYATMLVSGHLRAVHLTTHHSLAEACRRVTRALVFDRLRLTHRSFVGWGFPAPRIGVAALNPHAGEGGIMGREEIDEIAPAVRDATSEGIDAHGPYPADSIFNRAIAGEFDVVLAMYHDQGHIPVKVYGFEKSVSVALGLPFVRTSVDHGTAFDIAWRGTASAVSMIEAIKVAVSLASSNRL